MSLLVLKALNAVQKEIMATGIAKARRNQEQKFNFRGIDDALEAFGPLLAEHGVLLSPSYDELRIEPRQTKSGGTTYNASVSARFTFTHMEDGSTHTVGPFYGEANDGQDKAISKATSVAERNMFFLSFVVPHEPAIGGDPDSVEAEETELFDITPWADAIRDASDKTELDRIGDELKTKVANMPPNAARNIRALWAARAKVLA